MHHCQLVVSQNRPEFITALQELGDRAVVVLDLVRLSQDAVLLGVFKYQGISW